MLIVSRRLTEALGMCLLDADSSIMFLYGICEGTDRYPVLFDCTHDHSDGSDSPMIWSYIC